MREDDEPTAERSGEAAQHGLTTAQLKTAIDRGRTGDKVGGFDPAAAPLGTDAEAAGAPRSPELVLEARVQEDSLSNRRSTAGANAATPAKAPDSRLSGQPTLAMWSIVGVILGIALGLVFWAALRA